MKSSWVLFILMLTAACSAPTPELSQVQQLAGELASTLVAQLPTQTLQPTYTPYPTYTAQPTVVIVVTATESPTPLYTSTISPTPTETLIPTETPIPSATPDPLLAPKSAGIYLVGVDIAPGVWRNNGISENCYWEINTREGDIIDNHFGQSGGTLYLPPNAFQVSLESECGTWEYLGPP